MGGGRCLAWRAALLPCIWCTRLRALTCQHAALSTAIHPTTIALQFFLAFHCCSAFCLFIPSSLQRAGRLITPFVGITNLLSLLVPGVVGFCSFVYFVLYVLYRVVVTHLLLFVAGFVSSLYHNLLTSLLAVAVAILSVAFLETCHLLYVLICCSLRRLYSACFVHARLCVFSKRLTP